MAWLNAVDTNTPHVRTEYNKFPRERLYFATGSSNIYTRSRTIITDEYHGLTDTAAQAYVDTHAGDTDVVAAQAVRMNDAGAYKAVITTDSVGTWTLET